MSSQQTLAKKNVVHYTSNKLNISAGQEIRMPVVVNESESSKLHYSFTTTNHSISFAVNFFRDDGKKLVLLPPKQFNSHQTPIQGEVAVEGRGVLSVIWDNGYSWSDQSMSSHIKIEYARKQPTKDTTVGSKSTPHASSSDDTTATVATPPTSASASASASASTTAASPGPSPSTTTQPSTYAVAPSATACGDPRDAQLETKCKFLFTQFDRDKDGYLNCAEMNYFTGTVNVSQERIDDKAWIQLCRYWSLNPMQGMDYQTLLKVYRAVPGSVDSDMKQFFKRNPALRAQVQQQQHTPSVPEGYVEVAREDGSTYWTDQTMSHVIEGRPPPVVNTGPSPEAKTSGGSPSKPERRTSLSARDMIRHIFLYFDRDRDGFLNHQEMQRFSRVINNTTRTLTRQDWLKICQYWGATHKGITAEHLRDIYESDSGSTLANDYATIQALEREKGQLTGSAPNTVPDTVVDKASAAAPTPEVDAGLAKEDAAINQMAREIFNFFDQDKDGVLKKEEMLALSRETEEEGVRITEDKWEDTCKVMEVDPAVGLALSDLLRVYHREVDKDYLRVFGRISFVKAINNPFTTKAKAIFDHHDKDGDGFLNRVEMNAFTLATEDEQEALDEEQWRKVCGDMMIDPNEGIALTHLVQIYKQVLMDDYQVLLSLRDSEPS